MPSYKNQLLVSIDSLEQLLNFKMHDIKIVNLEYDFSRGLVNFLIEGRSGFLNTQEVPEGAEYPMATVLQLPLPNEIPMVRAGANIPTPTILIENNTG